MSDRDVARPSVSTSHPPEGSRYVTSTEPPRRKLDVSEVLIGEYVGHHSEMSAEPGDRGAAHLAVTVVEQHVGIGGNAPSVSSPGVTGSNSVARKVASR